MTDTRAALSAALAASALPDLGHFVPVRLQVSVAVRKPDPVAQEY